MKKLTEIYYDVFDKGEIILPNHQDIRYIVITDNVSLSEFSLKALLPVIDFNQQEILVYYTIKPKVDSDAMESIINYICDLAEYTRDILFSKTRTERIVKYRQMTMYFINKHTSLPLSEIGVVCGGKDHSTAIHSNKVVKKIAYTKDPDYYDVFRDAEEYFNTVFGFKGNEETPICLPSRKEFIKI